MTLAKIDKKQLKKDDAKSTVISLKKIKVKDVHPKKPANPKDVKKAPVAKKETKSSDAETIKTKPPTKVKPIAKAVKTPLPKPPVKKIELKKPSGKVVKQKTTKKLTPTEQKAEITRKILAKIKKQQQSKGTGK